jgi:phage terminase large subunit
MIATATPVTDIPVIKTGPLFTKIYDCRKKIIILQGGGDSSKTITALQYFMVDSIKRPGSLTTITAQDIPNIKGGVLRSFQKFVLPDFESYVKDYNKSDRIYTLRNKSLIEFKSFDDEQDARGSERDNLFINEANSINYAMFWQLQRKTRRKIILDYNPTSAFYVHERLLSGNEKQFTGKCQLFITDHRHNPFLTADEHEAYESISDPDLFKVYARGLTGKIKGLIFGHFKKCNVGDVPMEKNGTKREDGSVAVDGYDKIIYGVDYGYTNDPTSIMKIWCSGRKRYCKELCYEPGLSAATLKQILEANGYEYGQPIYSEADPNMINQLRSLRIPVHPAIKGPGSIAAGLSKSKEYDCYYFDSPNFEKEILNYKWITAQDILTGKEVMTNQPIDAWNHDCDAVRMALYTDSFRGR